MKRITFFLILVVFAGIANATVYYVSNTATGNGSGTSWENAFSSPAAAIASTTPKAGDEIWVKQGTYISATQLTWETSQNFYGGFNGTETARNQRSTDPSLTILEGTNTNRVLNAPSMASATIWDGFTIQKGKAETGAGAFLQKNAILSNCIFQNNTAQNTTTPYVAAGGGVYLQGTSNDADSIKVLNCIIKNNVVKTVITTSVAGYSYCGGGGIYVKAGSTKAVIRGCSIESNIADGLGTTNAIVSGGGIFMCDGIVNACTVKDNSVTNVNPSTLALTYAKNQGGGIFIMPQTSTSTVVQNSIITGNSSPTYVGGGIAIDPLYTSSVITGKSSILNCYITNNTTRGAGGGAITAAGNTASTSEYIFNNCVIANNESSSVASGGAGVFVNNILGTNVSPVVNNSVKFYNCTIVNNKMLTTNYGGAGIFFNFISADISNCVFWGNGSVGTLAPYHVRVKTSLTTNKMINCVFDSRFVESQVSPSGYTTDLTGKVIVDLNNSGSTVGTLYAGFVSPTNFIGKVVTGNDQTSFAAANWAVTYTSACVNNGAGLASVTTDITGLARPQGEAFDIGAYELKVFTISASANNETMGSVSGAGSKLSGSTVTLVATANSGYTFVNWTENGTPVSTNESYSFTVSADKTLDANFVSNEISVSTSKLASELILTPASNITVLNGGTLTLDVNSTTINSITIESGGKVTNNANKLFNANSLTINSDANGTGTYVDKGTSNILNSTVNQWLTAGRNYFISSPVTNAKGSVILGADGLSGNNLWQYNEVNSNWLDATSSTTELTTMKGFVAKLNGADGIISFNGTLNSIGSLAPITIYRTNNSNPARGFNIVGNPFPSYLNWDLASTSNLETTIWYRTKTSPEPVTLTTSYVFDTYNKTGGQHTSLGATTVSGLIPPMQSFWVRVSSIGSGAMTFENSNALVHADVNTNTLKAPSSVKSTQKVLKLEVSNGINRDETIIYFDDNASDNFDNYDSPKMSNSNAAIPEIYTTEGNEQLVINGLNKLTEIKELALGFNTGTSNNFNIKIKEMNNFEADTRIILKDHLLNREWDLTEGSAYSFSSDAINTNNRFSVIFKSTTFTTGFENINQQKQIFNVFKNVNNQISVNSNSNHPAEITVYNVMGKKLINAQYSGSNLLIDRIFNQGIYFVTIKSNGDETTFKVIIN